MVRGYPLLHDVTRSCHQYYSFFYILVYTYCNRKNLSDWNIALKDIITDMIKVATHL